VKLFAFIDTSVLLHYRFFRNVDWPTVLGSPEVVLVFAPVVLSELDRHKWAGARKEKARARAVVRALEELALVANDVPVRDHVSARGLAEEPDDSVFGRLRLQPSVADDRLLASLMSFALGEEDGHRVALLSADAGLRMKARSRLIEVISLPNELEEPDEPDETERALADARRELALVQNARPKLRLTLDGEGHIEWEVRLSQGLSPARRQQLLEEWRNNYPCVVPTMDQLAHPRGRLDPEAFSWMPGFISTEQAAERNTQIDEAARQFERYLDNWTNVADSYRRSTPLTFRLENTGSIPADGIHVRISTDADGDWLETLPDVPVPPEPPQPHDPLGHLHATRLPDLDYDELVARDTETYGPAITGQNPVTVEYRHSRVTHHVPVDLEKLFFRFNSNEAIRSFTIQYRLIAANIPEPHNGTLHVKVSVGEPVPVPAISPEDAQQDDDSAEE
jgi:hypothetical protein